MTKTGHDIGQICKSIEIYRQIFYIHVMVVSACALQKTGQATLRRYTTRLVIVLRLGLIDRLFVVDPEKQKKDQRLCMYGIIS